MLNRAQAGKIVNRLRNVTRSAPERNRTSGQRFRKPLLYPTELRGQTAKIHRKLVAEPRELEGCSTSEAVATEHRLTLRHSLAAPRSPTTSR